MEDQRGSPNSRSTGGKVYRSKLRSRGVAGRQNRTAGGASSRPRRSGANGKVPVGINSCDTALDGHNRNNNNTEQVGSLSMARAAQQNLTQWNTLNDDASGSCSSSQTEGLNTQPLSPGQKLIAAIQSGNMQAACHLLNQHRPDGGDHWISQNYFQIALLDACRAGQKFLVQQLVRAGAVVNLKMRAYCTTALHIAAQLGFVDIADFLLRNRALVNALDADLNTALILAVNSAGCMDMLNLLLSYHAKVHFANSEGTTALMKAVEVIDVDAIKILMRAGSDLRKKNKKRQTARDIAEKLGISNVFLSLMYETERKSTLPNALTKAALEGRTEAVRILLDCRHLESEKKPKAKYEQANENAKNKALDELIKTMCSDAKSDEKLYREKLEIAKIMFESGAKPDKIMRRHSMTSPLIEATRAGLYELVEVICRYTCVKPNVLGRGLTALMIAAEQGHVDILKLLLSINADVKVKTRSGDTALSLALSSGQVGSAEILLQNYKPAEAELRQIAVKVAENGKAETLKFLASHCNISDISQSLLKPAVISGSTETVKSLLDRGADINVPCSCGNTALVVALYHLKAPHVLEMVTFVVENGASINKGTSAESPLLYAVTETFGCFRYLLEKGADVNEVGDGDGNTPLLAAFDYRRLHKRHPDVVEILLDAGADPNKSNRFGKTALHMAVREGSTGIVRQLLTAGAELEARDNSGLTPLFMAVNRGQSDMIALLKRCGANMTVVDDRGNTALLCLLENCSSPQEEAVRLLAYDKDYINKQQKSGSTALMLAAKERDVNTMRILLELGADPNIVDNWNSDKPLTALSLILDKLQGTRDTLSCAEILIKHKALATLPSRCNIALHQAIMADRRQLVQLMVTHGMAPVRCDFTRASTSLGSFMLGLGSIVGRNLTPLAAALVRNRLVVARYLLENWFLTPHDLVGSQQLRDVRQVLEDTSKHDSLSFLDEHLSQPMSLVKLSFVTVSALLGEVAGREERVQKTPLPPILQEKLLFRHEMFPLDLEQDHPFMGAFSRSLADSDELDSSLGDSSDYLYDSDVILETYADSGSDFPDFPVFPIPY